MVDVRGLWAKRRGGWVNISCHAMSQLYLSIRFQVIVQDIHTDSQVAGVEWIRSIPALRTKLSTLSHDSMEITQREQDTLELVLTGAHF